MKKHFLLAGIAALMLAACNNKPASELTLSGLDPAKFQTEVNNAQTLLPVFFDSFPQAAPGQKQGLYKP